MKIAAYHPYPPAPPHLPDEGLNVARSALRLASDSGHSYALTAAPRSLVPGLTSNRDPGESTLRWLTDKPKCNQFLGEALYAAGYRMPFNRMADGSLHFFSVEQIIRSQGYFARLTGPSELRAGDVIALDYPKRGDGGGHVEIVSGIDYEAGELRLVGARKEGASEKRADDLLASFIFQSGQWRAGNNLVYFLRPVNRL